MDTLLFTFRVDEINKVESEGKRFFIPGCSWCYYTIYGNKVILKDMQDNQLGYLNDVENLDILGLYVKSLPGTYRIRKVWEHRDDNKVNMSWIGAMGWIQANRVFDIDEILLDTSVHPIVIRSFPEDGGIILRYDPIDSVGVDIYKATRWMGDQKTILDMNSSDITRIFSLTRILDPTDITHTIGVSRKGDGSIVEIQIHIESLLPSVLRQQLNAVLKFTPYTVIESLSHTRLAISDSDREHELIILDIPELINSTITLEYNEATKVLSMK